MSNPSAIAEARRLVADAQENLDARRRLLNSLLPELPADLTFTPGVAEYVCPHVNADGTTCDSWMTAVGYTDEVSPVLGWGPSESYDRDPATNTAVRRDVTALWFGDYEYGDNSTGIVEIHCGRGHGWQVPENTDRDV